MSLSKAMSSPTPGLLAVLRLSPDVVAAAYGGSPFRHCENRNSPMLKNSWPLAMLAITLAVPATNARAHEIVGNRFFPATLAIDDPRITDELALPTISMSKTGDNPSFKQLDVSAELPSVSPRTSQSPLRRPGRGFMRLVA
jgi:hypothetical protein